jgi:enterochelin esterase-like enzyme
MKHLILILSILLLSVSQGSAQPETVKGLNVSRDLVYYSQGQVSLTVDIYTPVVDRGEGNKTPVKPFPVIIWLPRAAAGKFPSPVASYTAYGYAVVAAEHNNDAELVKVIGRVVAFLKSNSQKYNIDPKNIGIVQQVERGYLAVIWEDGLKRLELLSDAPVRIGISAPDDNSYTQLIADNNSKALTGFFDRHIKTVSFKNSGPLKLSCPSDSWIDPVMDPLPGTSYCLFPEPSRGKGKMGSFLVLLPDDYRFSDKRYPVIYWLHGGNGNSREGAWMCLRMREEMKKGTMPPSIVIFVQGLPVGWYNNSTDSTMPVEDVLIRDLVPYIDAAYRTVKTREARAVEGMSMGGYGALHLGLKYPGLFGVVSAIAPSLTSYESEAKERILPVFGTDTSYFYANTPSVLAEKNRELISGKTAIRILVGDRDVLYEPVQAFHLKLESLGIKHQYIISKGAAHEYSEVISKAETDTFSFWKDTLGK